MAQEAVNKMVVIGGSAGSLDVVLKITASLPLHSGGAFVIVLHRKADSESILTALLSLRTTLPVKEVEDKENILPNTVYVAPPDYHLLLEDRETFSLDCSEKLHFSRPSIDITFEAAAEVFGSQCMGILLSGANADGAAGLKTIRGAKGFTVAQEPSSADVSFMPQQAIDLNAAAKILRPGEIGKAIEQWLNA